MNDLRQEIDEEKLLSLMQPKQDRILESGVRQSDRQLYVRQQNLKEQPCQKQLH
jgi:hypothetical protein